MRRALLALLVGVAVVALVFALRPRAPQGSATPTPTPAKPPAGDEVVSVFFAGLAALQSGDLARAEEKATALTRLAPGEMAGWANFGVLELRRGRFDEARSRLEQARGLAPASAEVEALLALVESLAGRSPEAIAHLRRAVTLDPADIRSRYALAAEIERAAGPDADAEAISTLETILEVEPDNLVVLIDRLRLAARTGDGAAIARIASRLGSLAPAWPAAARQRLGEVKPTSDPTSIARTCLLLRNLLVRTPAFQRDLSRVAATRDSLGREVEQLASFSMPASVPGDPDDGLGYELTRPGADPAGLPTALALAGSRSVADLNHDFRPDLAYTDDAGLHLLRQTESGTYEPMPGVPADAAAGVTRVWAADVDSDGDLDLVTGAATGVPRVLRNNADGTFALLTPFAGIAGLTAFAWADLDGDGDPDAAIADGEGRIHVARNERGGTFAVVDDADGVGAIAAVVTAEVLGGAALELVVLTADGRLVAVTADPMATGGFRSQELAAVTAKDALRLEPGSASVHAEDLDNNGAIDWIVSAHGVTHVLLSGADGPSRPRPPLAAIPMVVSNVADRNGDGLLDLAGIGSDGAPTAAVARATKGYHWLVLRARAQEIKGDQRINSFGIGGEAEIRSGLLWQKQGIKGDTVHFGLGLRAQADVARIVWPNGSVQAEHELKADTTVVAEQRLKGSCPWLFAWDGHAMAFVKDILWSSPLGLRINAQDTAGVVQTEDRVKIDGNALAPRDGKLDVAITAELWETHFFDHVALLVIDHPRGTEVFQDERFAVPPPPLAAVLTGPLRPLAMAHDQDDRDVTDVVRETDGRYLGSFAKGRYQGVAQDHWITLDLPEAAAPGRVLVARGWTHPTDSSVNLAIGQGRHDPPRALSLEIPDRALGWRVAQADLGFPAGKNKTMLIDLSGIAGATRIRLRTNMEIYWDALAVADRVTTPPRVTRLAPDRAELRWRGFSTTATADAASPEIPRHDVLATTAQPWRDLVGFYTRFGDVQELLAAVDDRYVILNAGDEIALAFPAPAPPPPDQTRDYVFVSDGWEKDGDLNTGFSMTVLPLPSHSDPSYRVARATLEEDPVYQRYPEDWERYHTRYVTPEAFRESLRPRSARLRVR